MSESPTPVRNLHEIMRDEMVMKDKILAALHEGPMTVPELAEGLGYPAHEVMYWVMAMRRYGQLVEQGRPDDEGYFQYAAAGENKA